MLRLRLRLQLVRLRLKHHALPLYVLLVLLEELRIPADYRKHILAQAFQGVADWKGSRPRSISAVTHSFAHTVAVRTWVVAGPSERGPEPVQALLGQLSPLLEASVPASDHLEKPAGWVQTRQDVLAVPSYLDGHLDADQEPEHGPEADRGGRPCLGGQQMAAPSSSLGYEVTGNGDSTA